MTSRSFIGERPVALGWGSTHYGGAEVGTLRGVDLPVWSQRECDDAYFQVYIFRPGQGFFYFISYFRTCYAL